VLELQLLLLAFQAKLRHQQLEVTQQGLSAVHALSKDSWWQEQQQQQQGQAIEQQQQQQQQERQVIQQQQQRRRRRLTLPASHDQLLSKYALKDQDLAQLKQQQQQQHMAGPPYIRYGMTLLT
jgi:hypothetical protein